MEFEAKQAYKFFETGVLDWKSKQMNPNQPISLLGSTMPKGDR